jgi:hypothetical protein
MKKISLLALTLMSGIVLFAQTATFGLKGGLNVASTSNSQGGGSNSRLGYHAGFLLHVHATPQFAVQPELVYSSQGGKYTTSDGYEHNLDLGYLNIPVLLQYMAGSGFRLETGPQVGFLVNVNDKVNGVSTGYFTSADFKKTDVSWAIGAGYEGRSGLGLDARYNLGLSNINNYGTATVHNNVLQVGLFYMLR